MNVTTRTALIAAVGAVLGATTAAPAVANQPRGPESSVSAVSPYAEPLAALGGRTLAQYLADHHAAGPAGS